MLNKTGGHFRHRSRQFLILLKADREFRYIDFQLVSFVLYFINFPDYFYLLNLSATTSSLELAVYL